MKVSSKSIKMCKQITMTIPILAVVCFLKRAQADSEEITSSCYAAKIQIEDSCPSTRSGWIHQAKLKQCSNTVLPCQKQLILEYHCLPNTWQNRTISVCTLPKFINGHKCAEFNLGGNSIQPLYETNCGQYIPPCPFRYCSLVAYKFQMCYLLKNSKMTEGSIEFDRKDDGTKEESSVDSVWSNFKFPWPFVVLVVFLSVGLGVHCVWRKLFGKQQRSSKNRIFNYHNGIVTTAVVTENSSLTLVE